MRVSTEIALESSFVPISPVDSRASGRGTRDDLIGAVRNLPSRRLVDGCHRAATVESSGPWDHVPPARLRGSASQSDDGLEVGEDTDVGLEVSAERMGGRGTRSPFGDFPSD